MKNVPGSIAELDGRFELDLSACEHAQTDAGRRLAFLAVLGADRGEYLHVCYDNQPKMTALPVFPKISRLMNEETSK